MALVWLHHAHPFVATPEKKPVSCRGAKRLVTELWSPRLVTYNTVTVSKIWSTVGDCMCSQLWHVTAANQRTVARDWPILATVGWKRGCQPFSCRCSPMRRTAGRRFVRHVCLKESIPAIPLGIPKHPLPTRSLRFLRATVPLHQFCILWLHHAHPFVAAAEKNLSHAERSKAVWSRSCGLQDLLQCSDCALSCAMWLLQTNEQLSRLSF